jgi:hypothetical protein
MEMDPNPPSFNLAYNVAPADLGKNYAAGMQAGQQAGESLGKGISSAFDVMTRNQNATDMLNAMQQTGMLNKDQYNAIANKSLGAKEQMLGMFGNQWMADQANQRALSLARGQAGVDVAKQHAQLLDVYNQAKAGNPAAVEPKKMFWQPNANVNTQGPQAPQPPPVPMQSAAGGPWLPGTRYVMQTDPSTGKTQKGHLLPSGQFVAE